METRQRLDDRTDLAGDLNAGATADRAGCGPGCTCMQPIAAAGPDLAIPPEPMIGAACTLDNADLPIRLAQWRAVRSRAIKVEVTPGGIRLHFHRHESMSMIADLAERETECCAFYAFALHVDGASRHLDISDGANGAPAVMALLGLDQ